MILCLSNNDIPLFCIAEANETKESEEDDNDEVFLLSRDQEVTSRHRDLSVVSDNNKNNNNNNDEMDARIGLDYIVENSDYVVKLAAALDTNNEVVKKQVFELLSALCAYSRSGYIRAMETLDNYKVKITNCHSLNIEANFLDFVCRISKTTRATASKLSLRSWTRVNTKWRC